MSLPLGETEINFEASLFFAMREQIGLAGLKHHVSFQNAQQLAFSLETHCITKWFIISVGKNNYISYPADLLQ